MKNIDKYPGVLIIYNSRINKADQHGVSIRGWFADWPRENLAQIYSGNEVGDESFCGFNFKLGYEERRLGKFFFKIKGSSLGQSSYPVFLNKDSKILNKFNWWSLFKNKISELLISTGLWEIIFKPKLSPELVRFVEEFKPQVIYCQGYNLTFSWLPVLLHNKFNIPICFQTGDDWPSDLYGNSPLAVAIRPIVCRTVKSLLASSSARLANGKLMAKTYWERYGISFEPLMMCDDLARFRKAAPCRVVSSDTLSIVYTGGLGHGRWVSIIDLCKAAELLHNKGRKVMVTILSTGIPQEAVNALREIDNLQILPGPSHEELPSYLKGADILYLPETFDPVEAGVIHLSISTKAHLYMMSERPVLVYASAITGIMDYAKTEEWAYIVQEHKLTALTEALFKLSSDEELQTKLVKKGLEIALKNHDAHKVRARFLTTLKGPNN